MTATARMAFLCTGSLLLILFVPKSSSKTWSGQIDEADTLAATLPQNASSQKDWLPALSLSRPGRRRKIRRQLRRAAEAQIVGGNPVNSQEYPFFVQSDASVSGGVCGGSLVADDFVLTAAHCFDSFNGSSKVLVGPYLRDSTEGPAQYRDRVGNLQVHPQYNQATIQYDLILFKIQPVSLPNLKPITLNLDADNPQAGQALTVIGMGVNDDGSTSNVLEGVQLTAVSHEQCQQEWSTSGGRSIDATSMVCASTTNGKDVCGGDSGGPLFDSQRRQVGLVSFGPSNPCANPIVSGVYSRVSGATAWIKKIVCNQSNDPPQYLCKKQTNPDTDDSPNEGGSEGGNNNNSNVTVPYHVEVKYGALPLFLGWKLVEPAGGNRGKRLARVPMGRVNRPSTLLTKRVSLKSGSKYKLVIKNGSSGRDSSGYVKLYRGSKLIRTVRLGMIGRKEVIKFLA